MAPRALIILLLKIIPNTASNTPIKSEKKKALGPKGTSTDFQYQGVIADEGLDDFWSKDEAAKR